MVHDEGLKKEKFKITLGGFEFDELNGNLFASLWWRKKERKANFPAQKFSTRDGAELEYSIFDFLDTFHYSEDSKLKLKSLWNQQESKLSIGYNLVRIFHLFFTFFCFKENSENIHIHDKF